MRKQVGVILQNLEDACRQTLYNGNFFATSDGDDGSTSKNEPSSKRARRTCDASTTTATETWETILKEAAELLPFMTSSEHGVASHFVSVLLLGFLLPQSTGNEFFLLQNLSSNDDYLRWRRTNDNSQQQHSGIQTSEQQDLEADVSGYYILHMPLAERLQCSVHRYEPNDFGEFQNTVHEPVDNAFCRFLLHGLAPFLARRPAHTQQVDLLHIIAMALHPHPSPQPIRETGQELKDSAVWASAKLLMESPVSACFHLHYRHRMLLLRMITDTMLLPEHNESTSDTDSPLFEGALPHLRAAIYAIGMAGLSPYDAHWAQCGLVSLAIQSGISYVVHEEWSRLLNRTMDDSTPCQCRSDRKSSHVNNTHSLMTQTQEDDCCPHRARGHLLASFLARHGEARHYADPKFLHQAISSLTDAIEFKLDTWSDESPSAGSDAKSLEEKSSKSEKMDVVEKKEREVTSEPVCLLASLLHAASRLFIFLPPVAPPTCDEEESDDSQKRDTLISCAIQLFHHSDEHVSREASNLLCSAFAYGSSRMASDYFGAVVASTKVMIRSTNAPVTELIYTMSRKSSEFADALASVLFVDVETEKNDDMIQLQLMCRLLSQISTACPAVAEKNADRLACLCQGQKLDQSCKRHLVNALLACRLARLFANNKTLLSNGSVVEVIQSVTLAPWSAYEIGNRAMVCGCYEVASELFNSIEGCVETETSFLWLASLSKLASGETILNENGATGLPTATLHLRSSATSIGSLAELVSSRSFSFQLEFLNLRLGFLDILIAIHQLARETRVTGVGPRKNTRSRLHLVNLIGAFAKLSSLYLGFYRRYGLFVSQQGRTVLRTLSALCRFVENTARTTFLGVLPERSLADVQKNATEEIALPKGDTQHPVTVFIREMESKIVQKVDDGVPLQVRASVLVEAIDRMLKLPTPHPEDFAVTRSVPHASFRLMLAPEILDHNGDDDEEEEGLSLFPGSDISLVANGCVPVELLKRSNLKCCMLLIWYKILFQPVVTEEAAGEKQNDTQGSPTAQTVFLNPAPIVTSMSSIGTFFARIESKPFLEEGQYFISARLGCRDVRGGEWELPVRNGEHDMCINVSSTR